ncbi:hypothetical protein CALCODRAFT_496457 [Calocera cornea HHB12733]|uniref:Zn(2)-C6 fungal-type domain-containing protein n=1 Tax=Calocera cornea HHB12733 TaxID=1353952 RepID=A0A165FSS3_9BASI|nr:hypothetical protein CALCODRAFT_496457 [Calocera cornea HHB12733]
MDDASSKKRKVYSSCDTCKLRRVKCERDSEDQACTKCIEKGINCTTAGPNHKKLRTGKRIEQARHLFGVGERSVSEGNGASLVPYSGTAYITPVSDDGNIDMRTFDSATARSLTTNSVDSRLSLAEVVSTLSSHLIDEYFSVTPFRLPLYRWQNFQEDFENAGRRPEQMGGMGEVIAHCLIASGSYVSSSPAILGSGAPSLKKIDSEESNFIRFGQQRAAVCKTLLDRAVSMAENHGVFRVESSESILVLLLLEILVDHNDESGRRGRPFRAAALCHAQSMSEDESMRDEYMELRGGGLGWLIYTRDTLIAGLSGRQPRVRDHDVQMLRGIEMTPVELPTEGEFRRALNGDLLVWVPVIRIWDHITQMTRQFAIRFAKSEPAEGRPQGDPFDDDFLPELYKDLDATTASVNYMQAELSQFFTRKRPGYGFFQHYCRTNYLGCIFVNFLIHRGITRELESLNERLGQAYLVPLDDSINLGTSEHEERRAKLLKLKTEADGRMQKDARHLVSILWETQNSLAARTGMGILTGVPMMYPTFPVFAEILCTMPTKEEGGSDDFPLETKIEEIGWLLSAYRSIGWAWEDMADLIQYLEKQHAKFTALKFGMLAPLDPQMLGFVLTSSTPSSTGPGFYSFAPPTPDSTQSPSRSDVVSMPPDDYTNRLGGDQLAADYGSGMQADLQPLSYTHPTEVASFADSLAPVPVLMNTESITSAPSLTDPFPDLYTMVVANGYTDGIVQPGALTSPTTFNDLQQWESLLSDQVPQDWDFGHSGFSPQPGEF